MSLIRINRNPNRRQLLVFGAAWLGVLGIAGCASWLRGRHPAADVLWALAVCVPLVGLGFPAVLRYAYLGLSYATYPIGFVVSYLVLAFAYFLVLTPIGLAMGLFRYDPLSRKFDPEAKSYWTPRDKTKTVESYFNQS